MRNIRVIAARELKSYFATPVAYVFIVIFLAFSGALAFYVGGFFDSGQASLRSFFFYHTWLYLLLIPAISMRLWAEERKTGTIELLMTLPVSVTAWRKRAGDSSATHRPSSAIDRLSVGD